jgi:hypothetical protein
MKVTKADFELFKQSCDKYIKKLGLVNWSVHYQHEIREGSYAVTASDCDGRVATITLSTYWDDLRIKTDHEIDKLALHEVLHIMMAPILREAEQRYTTQYVLLDQEHDIIRRLENLAS